MEMIKFYSFNKFLGRKIKPISKYHNSNKCQKYMLNNHIYKISVIGSE